MNEQKAENSFPGAVEIMGHSTFVGMVSEHTFGGETFVRVDVPERPGRKAFSKLSGKGAIYCITPVDEEVMQEMLKRGVGQQTPLQHFGFNVPVQIGAPYEDENGDGPYP